MIEEVWEELKELLLHKHPWIRISCSRLFGIYLKFQGVRILTLLEAESRLQVSAEVRIGLLDGFQDNFVDSLLIRFLRLRKTGDQFPCLLFSGILGGGLGGGLGGSLGGSLLLLSLRLRLFLLLLCLISCFLAVEKCLGGIGGLHRPCVLSNFLEVAIVELLFQLKIAEVHLGPRRDDVSLVNTTKRNAIHSEGTSDQEKSRTQLFQKDDPLALESTREYDQYGAGRDRFPQASRLAGEVARTLVSDGFFGVVSRGLGLDDSGLSFLPEGFGLGGFLLGFFAARLLRR